MESKIIFSRSTMQLRVAAVTLFVITFMVYTPTLRNDFVWDDGKYVCENNHIQSLDSLSLYGMCTTFYKSNWHPLTWLSHATDYAVWDLNPFGHHLTNIILHGFNTVLVFFLVMQLVLKAKEVNHTPSPSKMSFSPHTGSMIVASVTALLFGLHPLHVESVAWVAERKDLLCAFFFLLTLLSYLSYTSSAVNRHRWIRYVFCLLLFALALMSKSMAVTLPVTLLLIDIYPLRRVSRRPEKKVSVLVEKMPFFALSAVSSVLTILAQRSGGAIGSLEQFHLDARFLNGLRSIAFYLGKMILPINLVPYYPFPSHIHWLDLPYLLSALLVLTITGMCVWKLTQGKYLFFIVWSYFMVTLLPVLGIIQVGGQAAADRYTYLPGVSIFLVMGIGALRIFEKTALKTHRIVSAGPALAFICILAFLGQLTVTQIRIWHNPESLWSYVISAFPGRVALAHNNLGNAYTEKGSLDKAISEYKKSLELNPHYAETHNNLGTAYFESGKVDEAIAEYTLALTIKPDFVDVRTNLGRAYLRKGMINEVISEYKKVLDLRPLNAEIHYDLGVVYYKGGEVEEAIAEYKYALTIKPGYAEAHDALGVAYAGQGKLNEALIEYEKALAINPRYVEGLNNLGLAYAEKGRLDEAIASYHKALSLNPQVATARYNLGLVYYGKRKFEEAVSEFRKAIEINPSYAKAHYALGLAYYYRGDYKPAITHCDRAVALGENVSPEILELLEPYR
jgi:tetratricopeptide (TPR) repeat protein